MQIEFNWTAYHSGSYRRYLISKCSYLLRGRIHDGSPRAHVGGKAGCHDLNIEADTLRGARVEDSAAHVVDTLLQLTLNGPGIEGQFPSL